MRRTRTDAAALGPDPRGDLTGGSTAHPSGSGLASPTVPADAESWPTLTEAMVRTGLSASELARAHRAGIVSRALVEHKWRYDPAGLDALSTQPLEPEQPPLGADVLRASAEAMRAAQEHAERMFRLFESPTLKALELLSRENERLAKQCETLQQAHASIIEIRERLASEHADRELAARMAASADARKERVFSLVREALPRVLASYRGGAAAPRGDVASRAPEAVDTARVESVLAAPDGDAAAAALELVRTMDPEKLALLLGSGVLDEVEEELVRRMMPAGPANGVHAPP